MITFEKFDNLIKNLEVDVINSNNAERLNSLQVFLYDTNMVVSHRIEVAKELHLNIINSNKENINWILQYYLFSFDKLYDFQTDNAENHFYHSLRDFPNIDINDSKQVNKFRNQYLHIYDTLHYTTRLILEEILYLLDKMNVNYKKIESTLINKKLRLSLTNGEKIIIKNNQIKYNSFEWLLKSNRDTELKELYNSLLSNKYIDKTTKFNNFKLIFGEELQETIIPILWNKGITDLAYFIQKLRLSHNIVQSQNDFYQLKQCFILSKLDLSSMPNSNLAIYFSDSEKRISPKSKQYIDKIIF